MGEKENDKTVQEKMANNEAIWLKAEASLEAEDKEDETPPPLPDKDYETGRLDTLSAKLQALVDAAEVEDGNRTPENNDDNPDSSGARVYNRTFSDEYNQNTSILNSNLTQDTVSGQSIIEEETDDQKSQAVREESSAPKFYAPDSSDDDDGDDDDDDFASREVNFDDSESEDEDFDQYLKNTSQENIPRNIETTITEDDDEQSREEDDSLKTTMNGPIGSRQEVRDLGRG